MRSLTQTVTPSSGRRFHAAWPRLLMSLSAASASRMALSPAIATNAPSAGLASPTAVSTDSICFATVD